MLAGFMTTCHLQRLVSADVTSCVAVAGQISAAHELRDVADVGGP